MPEASIFCTILKCFLEIRTKVCNISQIQPHRRAARRGHGQGLPRAVPADVQEGPAWEGSAAHAFGLSAPYGGQQGGG